MNYSELLQLAKGWGNFIADRIIIWRLPFDKFKKEALQRKNLVKTGKASPKEFTDWLYAQSTIIFKLCE